MASAPLRKQAGPVAATGPAGVPAVHKAAPQGADAHGGCRTRCALRRHAAPRGRAESGAGSGQQAAVLLLYALQKHTSSRYARIRKVSAHSGKIPISRRVVYHIKRNDTDIIRDALSQDREL